MYNFTRTDPFTEQELEALRQRLAGMDQAALTRFYNSSLHLCMLTRDKPPRASFVQQFVQAWKELAKREQQPNEAFQLQPAPLSVQPKRMARAGERARVQLQDTDLWNREDVNSSTIPA